MVSSNEPPGFHSMHKVWILMNGIILVLYIQNYQGRSQPVFPFTPESSFVWGRGRCLKCAISSELSNQPTAISHKEHTVIDRIRKAISDQINNFWLAKNYTRISFKISASLRTSCPLGGIARSQRKPHACVWFVNTRARDQPFCQYRRSYVSCFHPCHSKMISPESHWTLTWRREKSGHSDDFLSCKVFRNCSAQCI